MNVKNGYIIVLFMTLLLAPFLVNATNLRGQVKGANPYSRTPYPLERVTVDLYMPSSMGWRAIGRYVTGPDGMFYFSNIAPGQYSIQINGRQNYAINVFNSVNQDLPPIFISY
ncbi:hypothetical protein [Aliivibrio kagoshimensis]|uniref:hypothetical protein n=1 Tax=Aliivibrio kagoshimensis TaxID=2910230 RepID=UPI003D10C7EF